MLCFSHPQHTTCSAHVMVQSRESIDLDQVFHVLDSFEMFYFSMSRANPSKITVERYNKVVMDIFTVLFLHRFEVGNQLISAR